MGIRLNERRRGELGDCRVDLADADQTPSQARMSSLHAARNTRDECFTCLQIDHHKQINGNLEASAKKKKK